MKVSSRCLPFFLASLSLAAALPARATSAPNPLEVQAARTKLVKGKGYRVFYHEHFNLDDLPPYRPEQKVSGLIRMWGSNYFTDSPLMDWWIHAFHKFQPDVQFSLHLDTSEHAIPGLIFGKSDLGPLGREIMWDEELSFQREFNHLPLGVEVVTGSYDVSGWNPAIGVFVNRDNPLTHLSLQQIDGIFGAERSGAWRGMTWDTSLARGPEKNIRTWGQLGLTGKWKDRPIHVLGYNLQFHFPQNIETRAFGGVSGKWNEHLQEFANTLNPDGTLSLAGQQMLDEVSRDPYAIAYIAGGTRMKMGHTKALALSVKTDGVPYALTLRNVRDRTYPMYDVVYFYMNRTPGQPLDPKLKEFLRFILSRDGQALVEKDGKYLPLTGAVVREQRHKLQ